MEPKLLSQPAEILKSFSSNLEDAPSSLSFSRCQGKDSQSGALLHEDKMELKEEPQIKGVLPISSRRKKVAPMKLTIENANDLPQNEGLSFILFSSQTDLQGIPPHIRSRMEVADLHIPRDNWRDGLFSCFNNIIPSCALSFLCPFMIVAQISDRLQVARFLFVLIFSLSVTCIALLVSILTQQHLMLLAPLFYFISVAFGLRTIVRHKYFAQHQNACCSDIVASCFYPLSISQMARHIYDYEKPCDGCSFSSHGMMNL